MRYGAIALAVSLVVVFSVLGQINAPGTLHQVRQGKDFTGRITDQFGTREVTCTIINGPAGTQLIIANGDLILGSVKDVIALLEKRDISAKGLVFDAIHQWPNKTVLCDYSQLNDEQKRKILKAEDWWTTAVPKISFRESNAPDAVKFCVGGGYSSTVGYWGPKRGHYSEMPTNPEVGNIAHELGHVLGLFHEHARADRDQNISVLDKNVQRSHLVDFKQPISDQLKARDKGSYDFESIMHYERNAFSSNGKPTIETKDPSKTNVIGQRNQISKEDEETVNAYYQ